MEKYDHEHPCPSDRCIAVMRRLGYDIPEDVDCCVCLAREQQKRVGHPEGGNYSILLPREHPGQPRMIQEYRNHEPYGEPQILPRRT